jgi:hypothetical protein
MRWIGRNRYVFSGIDTWNEWGVSSEYDEVYSRSLEGIPYFRGVSGIDGVLLKYGKAEYDGGLD